MKNLYVSTASTIKIDIPFTAWNFVSLSVLINNTMYTVRVHMNASSIYEMSAYNANNDTSTSMFTYSGNSVSVNVAQYSSILITGKFTDAYKV